MPALILPNHATKVIMPQKKFNKNQQFYEDF